MTLSMTQCTCTGMCPWVLPFCLSCCAFHTRMAFIETSSAFRVNAGHMEDHSSLQWWCLICPLVEVVVVCKYPCIWPSLFSWTAIQSHLFLLRPLVVTVFRPRWSGNFVCKLFFFWSVPQARSFDFVFLFTPTPSSILHPSTVKRSCLLCQWLTPTGSAGENSI